MGNLHDISQLENLEDHKVVGGEGVLLVAQLPKAGGWWLVAGGPLQHALLGIAGA